MPASPFHLKLSAALRGCCDPADHPQPPYRTPRLSCPTSSLPPCLSFYPDRLASKHVGRSQLHYADLPRKVPRHVKSDMPSQLLHCTCFKCRAIGPILFLAPRVHCAHKWSCIGCAGYQRAETPSLSHVLCQPAQHSV